MGVVTAIIATATAIYQASEAEDAEDRQHAARQEQKKANEIQRAEQAERDAATKRRKIREDRIRRAQILASSESAGVTASSSQFGTQSALTTDVGTQGSFMQGQAMAADAISARLQTAADLEGQADAINTRAAGIASVATTAGGALGTTKWAKSIDKKLGF